MEFFILFGAVLSANLVYSVILFIFQVFIATVISYGSNRGSQIINLGEVSEEYFFNEFEID